MYRTTPLRRAIVGLTAAFAMTISLSACGEESDDPGAGTGAPVPSASADTSLADKVPADIKAAGKLVIGTDSTYAPNEYLDADGKTVIGFDVDLFNAVAQKLGLTTEWQSAKFDAIIPGVSSGKYTVGVSSFTVNADRMKEATMVSYFSAGTQWAAKAGATINPDDACGKKVAVQVGTVQLDDITARSKKCTDGGKAKITIDQYQSQADATNAVVSGKDDAMLADSPVGAYAVKQTNGQLALLGPIYLAAPYGYVLPKNETAFGAAIAGAVKDIMADGTYNKIITKWGVQAGAITNPTVNPTP
jgi:polar amino acid transport system substrate-binding protein